MFLFFLCLLLVGSASALERLDDRLCIDLLHYLAFARVTGEDVRLQLRRALRHEMCSFLESASTAATYVPLPAKKSQKKSRSASAKAATKQASGYLYKAKRDGVDIPKDLFDVPEGVDDTLRFKVVKHDAPSDTTMKFETTRLYWQDIVRVDTLNHSHKEYYKYVLFVQVEEEGDSRQHSGVAIFLAKDLNEKESVLTRRILGLFSTLEKDRGDFGLALMICLYHRAKAAIFKTKMSYTKVREYRLPRPLGDIYGSL